MGRGIREFKGSLSGDGDKDEVDSKRAELEASEAADPKQKPEPVEGEVVTDRKV
jgi:hypothetical protein